MATIITFPRTTTPRRKTSSDYNFLSTLAAIQAAKDLTPVTSNPHALADMLRSIAEELDRLYA